MAVLLAKNERQVLGEILYDITNSTTITRTSPGSKFRAFAESITKKMSNISLNMNVDLMQAFLAGADDQYLDFFGETFNRPRYGSQTAEISSVDLNVKFYVSTGTFGSINGGNSIFLPSGVTIASDAASGTTYRLQYSTVLKSSDSEMYVTVKCSQDGEVGNIGAGKLVYHNFNNYADFANKSLKVTNLAEIVSGREIESNENYRYRLSNALLSNEGANFISIRLAALGVPGVADLVFIPFSRGLSTFDIIIKSTSPKTPSGLVSAVDNVVRNVTAEGVFGVVRAPKEVGTSMDISLILRESVSEAIKEEISYKVMKAVTGYINNLDIGEELIINEIVQRVMEVDDLIKDMGKPTKPLDSIYIYKKSRLEDNKIRETLDGNYITKSDERLIIETDEVSGDPVSVTFIG